MKKNIARKTDSISSILGEGIVRTFDPGLKRSFDVENSEVDSSLKNTNKLVIKKNHLKVSGDGVFYTLQGEGISMGQPAVFLRLHFCNLRCVWCDAYYTWNPSSDEFWTELQDWSISKTLQRIKVAWKCESAAKGKRLIITGGEPLLQKNMLDVLIDRLPDWSIEIETNGTIMPTPNQLARCQFNCSPKLNNSKNIKAARYKTEVIRELNKVNTVFKFVILSPRDLDEIEDDFVKTELISVDKILVMPQGVTSQEVWSNAKKIVEIVKVKGYRMMGRLHVDIWGARRKV